MAATNSTISTTFDKLIDMMTHTKDMTDLDRERYITGINNDLNRADNPLTTVNIAGTDYSAREIRKWHHWDHRLTLPIFPTFTFTPNTYFYIPELHIFLMRIDDTLKQLQLYQRPFNGHMTPQGGHGPAMTNVVQLTDSNGRLHTIISALFSKVFEEPAVRYFWTILRFRCTHNTTLHPNHFCTI